MILSGEAQAQAQALEKAKEEQEAYVEIETEHPGYLAAQDTCCVGKIKGWGASTSRRSWTCNRVSRSRRSTIAAMPSSPPICNIEDNRARERHKEMRNRAPGAPRASVAGKLIEGSLTTDWMQALAQLPSLAYPERINPHL